MLATYRIKYARLDNVKYISHLDMLKLFTRAARRCDLPVAYSAGFNPHPLFVFGMPLPVGTTSEAEYLDITMEKELSCDDIINRLNDTMPEGVRILQAVILPEKASTIMKDIVASAYRVSVPLAQFEDGAAAVTKIVEKSREKTPLVVMKHTKSGSRETDVRDMIFYVSLWETDSDRVTFYMITAAGNEATLRPDLALCALYGDAVQVSGIHRLRLLTKEELKREDAYCVPTGTDY